MKVIGNPIHKLPPNAKRARRVEYLYRLKEGDEGRGIAYIRDAVSTRACLMTWGRNYSQADVVAWPNRSFAWVGVADGDGRRDNFEELI